MVITGLPDLDADRSEDAIRRYAKESYFNENWIRDRIKRGKVNGRSFCGIAIRVKGRPWGVSVIDSRSPESLKKTSEQTHEMMGNVLAKLLERV